MDDRNRRVRAFVAGGFRGLIDGSPMRYDAAIYLGGAPFLEVRALSVGFAA